MPESSGQNWRDQGAAGKTLAPSLLDAEPTLPSSLYHPGTCLCFSTAGELPSPSLEELVDPYHPKPCPAFTGMREGAAPKREPQQGHPTGVVPARAVSALAAFPLPRADLCWCYLPNLVSSANLPVSVPVVLVLCSQTNEALLAVR